jgi:hypothetical protein
MENTIISQIESTQIHKPAVTAKVQSVTVIFQSDIWARINLVLFDEAGALVDNPTVDINEEESAGWVDDDRYILQLALNKLGLTIIPTEEELLQ